MNIQLSLFQFGIFKGYFKILFDNLRIILKIIQDYKVKIKQVAYKEAL